jgi:hypothetical protein
VCFGVVRDQKSQAAPAGLGPDEALARILQGTGLKFQYLTPHSILAAAIGPSAETTARTPLEDELQEVIVTANRRAQNLQDVPIAIQVLTGATLVKLNATTFDDFVKYLPAVTAHGVGPAQNNIYARGLATAATAIQAAGYLGGFPNVALYLDEQSVQGPRLERTQHRGRWCLESQRVGQASALLLDKWQTHRFQHTRNARQYESSGSARGARKSPGRGPSG